MRIFTVIERLNRFRRGSVLFFVLLVVGLTTFVAGSLCAYYTGLARTAHFYQERSHPRAVLIQVAEHINQKIKDLVAKKVDVDVSAGSSGLTPQGLVAHLQQNFATDKIDGYDVKMEYVYNEATKLLELTAKVYQGSGGAPYLTLREEIKFDETTSTTLPIFNYVYFANNYGHLQASGVVANGNVGANYKLKLKGATINGFATAADEIELDSSTPPRIYPYKCYLNKVTEEYSLNNHDYFAQVRPTDPLYRSPTDTNPVDWKGGYRAPEGNPYEEGSYDSWKWERAHGGDAKYFLFSYWVTDGKSTEDIGMELDEETESMSGEKILQEKQNFIKMPNVSDVAKYRQFCQNYIRADGGVGGTLLCTNMYGLADGRGTVTNIAWSQKYNDLEQQITAPITEAFTEQAELRCDRTRKSIFSSWTYYWTIVSASTNNYSKIEGSGTAGELKEATSTTNIIRYLTCVSVNHGYVENIYPFAKYKNGKMEENFLDDDAIGGDDCDLNDPDLQTTEKGSVILIGTSDCPVYINGPVYFDGDVLIRGFVSGQGTIYSGRNIHVLGDITYLNPPSWPHSGNENPEDVAKINENKDILSLVARGNIIVGNYASADWMTGCEEFLTDQNGYFNKGSAACNQATGGYDDQAIGYPSNLSSFDHNYKSKEQCGDRMMVEVGMQAAFFEETPKTETKGTFTLSSSSPSYLTTPNSTDYNNYYYTSEKKKGKKYPLKVARVWKSTDGNSTFTRRYHRALRGEVGNRCFYQSKLGSDVITNMVQTGDSSCPSWRWSTALQQQYYRQGDWSGRSGTSNRQPVGLIGSIISAIREWLNRDKYKSGDIANIDSVLFANHGIFGIVGGEYQPVFTLNGAMICRDEGLLPSFSKRASYWSSSSDSANVWLNWDMRIQSDSREGLKRTGVPEEEDTSSTSQLSGFHVLSWQLLSGQ